VGAYAHADQATDGMSIFAGEEIGGAGAGETWSGQFILLNPGAAEVSYYFGQFHGHNSAGDEYLCLLSGKWLTATAVTGLRVLPGSGTFITGEFYLFRRAIS